MPLNANWLASLVIYEIDPWLLHQHRSSIAGLEFGLAGAAHDLLGRDAVRVLRKRADKFDTATGNDEGLEAARSQKCEQF
ncbi:hypothetical protein D3C71_1922290 [compost metagenome]